MSNTSNPNYDQSRHEEFEVYEDRRQEIWRSVVGIGKAIEASGEVIAPVVDATQVEAAHHEYILAA